MRRLLQTTLAVALFVTFGSVVGSADLNSAAIAIKLPAQIPWVESPSGAATYNIVGDPAKPGWYAYLNKWHPNHMSRPHTHQFDRFITVLSGTWWVGTGPKYDPNTTTPVRAGSFVTHFANQIHWDGAKDEEVVLEIVGMGPATSTNAEQK